MTAATVVDSLPTGRLSALLAMLRERGGWTLSPDTLTSPAAGFAVSVPGGYELPMDAPDAEIEAAIAETLAKAEAVPDGYAGAWLDAGSVYLDVSRVVPTREEALRLARANGQLAVYDIANGQDIRT